MSLFIAAVKADEDDDEVDGDGTVEEDLGKSRDGSRTDDEVVQRWVPAIGYHVWWLLMSGNQTFTLQGP